MNALAGLNSLLDDLARTRMVAGYTNDVSYRRCVARGGLPIEFSEGRWGKGRGEISSGA